MPALWNFLSLRASLWLDLQLHFGDDKSVVQMTAPYIVLVTHTSCLSFLLTMMQSVR